MLRGQINDDLDNYCNQSDSWFGYYPFNLQGCKIMNKYEVEFTDTHGGEANYSWIENYIIEADSMKQAITKAKQHRYYSPIPKHTMSFYDSEWSRINITGACVCAFITLLD
jgi:hypothetical protein